MNLSNINATSHTGVSPFEELLLSEVYPNPEQPRKNFANIDELASTIKKHGLLEAISVKKTDKGYMIVAGERRYKAHLLNGAKTIKAHIVEINEQELKELALIENIQREDLTDLEKANYITQLWESGKYKHKQDLAEAIGKQASYVSKSLGLLKLDEQVLQDIEENKTDISLSVMEEISRVDKSSQKEVYDKYKNKEIIRDDIKEYRTPKISPVKEPQKPKVLWTDTWTKKQFNEHFMDYAIDRFNTAQSDAVFKITVKEL